MAIGATRINNDVATLSSMMDAVKNEDAGKHIRWEDGGVGLHTTGKVAGGVQNFLAKIGLPWAKENQAEERKGAVHFVKFMIDDEFGKGTSDLVFKQMKNLGKDLDKGITVGDLKQMQNLSKLFQNFDQKLDRAVEHNLKDDKAFIYDPNASKVPMINIPQTEDQKVDSLLKEIDVALNKPEDTLSDLKLKVYNRKFDEMMNDAMQPNSEPLPQTTAGELFVDQFFKINDPSEKLNAMLEGDTLDLGAALKLSEEIDSKDVEVDPSYENHLEMLLGEMDTRVQIDKIANELENEILNKPSNEPKSKERYLDLDF